MASQCHHYGVIIASLWRHYGVTMSSLWCHYSIAMASLWCHYKVTMASLWSHDGFTMASQCPHYSVTLATLWLHFGYTLASLWRHYGIRIVSQFHSSSLFHSVPEIRQNWRYKREDLILFFISYLGFGYENESSNFELMTEKKRTDRISHCSIKCQIVATNFYKVLLNC